ncbi:interaptin-like [Agrilus planipennis]|uniref:Interaptin-like n=1 Tax=Agrilus planipennis TaxID=224129 RepID=A0A1W4X8X8_AGRPL|nr:interaptin-like [Agrilus planipennis]
MGNSNRSFSKEADDIDLWWDNNSKQSNDKRVAQLSNGEVKTSNGTIPKEVSYYREKRLQILSEKKKEFEKLRHDLATEKKQNENLRLLLKKNGINIGEEILTTNNRNHVNNKNNHMVDTVKISELAAENEQLKTRILELECNDAKVKMMTNEENRRLQMELAKLQNELQSLNAEICAFEKERQEYNTHVTALKDIVKVSKELLEIRQNQIVQLNTKIEQLQKALSDKEIVAFSADLREEYQRQLKNIRELRVLYEERQAAAENAKEKFKKDLEECQKELQEEKAKSEELNNRIEELEKDNSEKYDKIANLELSTKMKKAECNELQAQLTVINQLFSEIILGFRNGHEIDMDKLIDVLEENHDLLTDIVVNEESYEISSTLPKVLLDLIHQVRENERMSKTQDDQNEACGIEKVENPPDENAIHSNLSMNSAAEIVQNLPKVWRVLAELLSHQQIPIPVNDLTTNDEDPCYKSIQTPTGPRLVLSVSGTFIRLKDLIVEKKSLEKETFHLKQLNTHLESRLQDQEKRLEIVTAELSKTWHVVGNMQKQHQHLHTQEKILRYELAQKRKLLTELKEELEYCREKWLMAREKNNKTEIEWKELRDEFANRKRNLNDDLNNSIESGYSDERDMSSDDDVYERDETNSPATPHDESSNVSNEPSSVSVSISLSPFVETATVEDEEDKGDVTQLPKETSIFNVVEDEINNIESSDSSPASNLYPKEEIDVTEVESAHSIDGNVEETEKSDKVLSVSDNNNDCMDTSCLCNSGYSTSPSLVKARQTEIEETYKRLESDILMTVAKAQKGESFNPAPTTSKVPLELHSLKCESLKSFPSYFTQIELAKPQQSELLEGVVDCDRPSTSSASSKENRTPSEILATREERLRRLEEECNQLTFKVLSNSYRGCQISRKLSDLHEKHGSSVTEDDSSSDSENNE